MAKAEGYISEYEAAIADYNKLVEQYNASIDAYEQSFYEGGPYMGGWGEVTIGENYNNTGYYTTNLTDFGITARKPIEIAQGEVRNIQEEAWGADGQFMLTRTIVRDPVTGQEYTFDPESRNPDVPNVRPWFAQQPDDNTVITREGTILRFAPLPGDFMATMPTFDQEKYQTLLTEDITAEQQAIRDALEKTYAEDRAKFEEQRAEMERNQAIFAAETAAAEEQARKNLEQAQADAASAQEDRVKKEAQFKDETETMQRNVGARRAGFIRARRMRSRSLLSGA